MQDHRYLAAADGREVFFRHGENIFAVINDLAAGAARQELRQQAQNGHAQRRFAGSAFPHKANGFPCPHLQRHIVDDARCIGVPAQAHRQVLDAEQRLVFGVGAGQRFRPLSAGLMRSASASPRILTDMTVKKIASPGSMHSHHALVM